MSSSDDVIVTKQPDVVSAEELATAYQRWEAPQMVSVTDVEEGTGGLLTIEDIEKIEQQAQEEGFKAGFEKGKKAGYQAGFESGQAEISQQISMLKEVLDGLNEPLHELDAEIERDLVNLAITMARQLVRRELKAEPEHVIGAMRAALSTMPISDRKLKVFVNPQDLEIIKKGLSMEHDDLKWQWVEDPLITRGGVRIESIDTTVDATVEARLTSIINKVLGEERSDVGTE